jgi:hypothetical protein
VVGEGERAPDEYLVLGSFAVIPSELINASLI